MLVHVFLVLIAIVWVVSTVTDGAGKKDPNAFATGAGGGSGGPKAKEFKTKAVPKNVKSLAKTNTRITSKNANATLAIASLPSLSNPLLSAGAIGGGSSKGFGGGSGSLPTAVLSAKRGLNIDMSANDWIFKATRDAGAGTVR
ncbi:MAG: hypothetical protein ACKO8X_07090 [Verrucomicrobiota bacterium]